MELAIGEIPPHNMILIPGWGESCWSSSFLEPCFASNAASNTSCISSLQVLKRESSSPSHSTQMVWFYKWWSLIRWWNAAAQFVASVDNTKIFVPGENQLTFPLWVLLKRWYFVTSIATVFIIVSQRHPSPLIVQTITPIAIAQTLYTDCHCTHQREDSYAELEVGAGATLGQMAEKAQRSGWQVKMEKMKNDKQVENINHSSSTIIFVLPGIICTSDTRGDRGRRRGFTQPWSRNKQVDKLANMLGRQRQRQKEDKVYPG